jgi:hypothetical protein
MEQDLIIDAEAFEALGVKAPEDKSPDDTAAGTGGEGDGETTPPAAGGHPSAEGNSDGDDDGDGDGPVGAGLKPAQNGEDESTGARAGLKPAPTDGGNDAQREKNAKNAERRRRNEAKVKAQIAEAAEAARREARASFESSVKGLGITDPVTGEAVDSLEKLEKYKAARVFEQARDGITNGDLTPEAFNALVEQTPAFQRAAEAVRQAEQAQAEARKTQAEAEAARQIEQIGRYDASVKSIDDLLKLDRADTLRGYVMDKGLTLIDAYRLTYADEIETRRADAAAAQAAKMAKSKQHLTRTDMRGAGAPEVPPEQLDAYKTLLPGWDDEKIRSDYGNYITK